MMLIQIHSITPSLLPPTSYYPLEFTDFRDTDDISSFRYIPCILCWDDDTSETEFYSFLDTFIEKIDTLHDSSERYFSEKYRLTESGIIPVNLSSQRSLRDRLQAQR